MVLLLMHTFLPCLYLADPATFQTSNSVLYPLFSSEISLFIQNGKKETFLSL